MELIVLMVLHPIKIVKEEIIAPLNQGLKTNVLLHFSVQISAQIYTRNVKMAHSAQ